ncbi:MAG: response regulator [Phycisphaerae bacterium]|nr:response regulator [Phycisphaerae bacterium]
MEVIGAPETVAIVDDDESLTFLMKRRLELAHFNIITFHSGREAIAWLREHSVDLLLLDYYLADMTGAEVICSLTEAGVSLPFILMTGHGDEELAVEMMTHGALDYIVKNIAFLDLLLPLVGQAMKRIDQKHRLAQAEIELRKAHDELEIRVRERTAELSRANELLKKEISDRKEAESKLMIYQKRLRNLASELSITEYRERKILAADLHDSIGQNLAFTQIKLEMLRADCVSQEMSDSVDELCKIIAQTIKDTHSLIFDLSPPVLHELGYGAAVKWLADQVQQTHGLNCIYNERNHDISKINLDDDCRMVLFRATRELLVNVAKHAKASYAQIKIGCRDDAIQVTVEDDGMGFDASSKNARIKTDHFGLFNVQERLEHFGGELVIHSNEGKKTKVKLIMPLK